MNKGYNLWIFFISVLALCYSFLVNMRETVGSFKKLKFLDATLDYQGYIYAGVAGIILLISGSRSVRKWSGMKIVNRLDKFLFNSPISMERKRVVVTNNTIEIVFLLLFGISLLTFASSMYILPLVFLILIIDNVFNMMLGISKQKYRVGMTKKAIVEVDREVKALYFKGLKRISKHNDILFFEYVNDLVLDIQLTNIPEEKRTEFLDLLKENVDKNKVYFTGFEGLY